MKGSWTSVPWWRRGLALIANWFRMVVLYGLRSWWRDLRMVTLAIGSLSLVLMLCGFLALTGVGLAHATGSEAGQASMLRVYLAPDATDDQVAALRDRLSADRRVASVRELTSEQAMAEAQSRPGLGQLAGLATSNPFPASLDVKVRRVTDVGALAASVERDPAVDQQQPTSYDPDTYARLRRLALIAGAIGGGLALLFLFVAYSVAANAMRSVALSRRDEVALMRLLAARNWMLRGPFVVEGLTTGAFAGALAGAAVAGAWILTVHFANATFVEVLPGVGRAVMQDLVAAIMVAGIMLGSLTAWSGFRRLGT